MSLVLTDENYNGLGSLQANSGDWVDGEVKFYSRFDIVSSLSNPIEYNSIAGNTTLSLPGSDTWTNYGFKVGMTITIEWLWSYSSGGTGYNCPQSFTRTITYINGSVMHIDSSINMVACGGTPVTTLQNGWLFPSDPPNNSTELFAMTVYATDAAEQVNFDMNLAISGTDSLNSVIDGTLNSFTNDAIGGMVVLDTLPLTQLGNASGGYIKDVVLTYDAVDGDSFRNYTITYKFIQWGFLQSGFAEPDYFADLDDLSPSIRVSLTAEANNPNTRLSVTGENLQANTGGFNENYNGGVNNFSLTSIDWLNALGDPIDAMDYSGDSTFTAVVSAPLQLIGSSTYRIGLVFRPVDESIYQNLPLPVVNNLIVNAPDLDYMHSASPDATIRAGFANSDGVQISLKDIQFFTVGTVTTITGKILPNAAAIDYFNDIPDGGRKVTLWASFGDHTTDGTSTSKRVNLKLQDEDIIDAPIVGVQIPNIVTSQFIDHDSNIVTSITTEDDVLYKTTLRLIDNIDYESMRVRMQAYNSTTGESFTLEDYNFSFSNVVNIAGQFQPNITIDRGFNLPSTSDRNVVTLKRDATLDIAGQYGIEINYGFLSRWEYWLAQSGVSNDFFDVTQPNDGLNKNWQRYSADANWQMRVEVNTIVNDVEDFNYTDLDIRPYEDEDVTTVVTIVRVSDGATVTAFENNEIHEVTAVLTWNIGSYTTSWAEATIEEFESGNRWLISSVLDHSSASNPLSPITGLTKLSLATATNVATLKFLVDTSKVSSNKISLSYRISDLNSGAPVNKTTTLGGTKTTTTALDKTIA